MAGTDFSRQMNDNGDQDGFQFSQFLSKRFHIDLPLFLLLLLLCGSGLLILYSASGQGLAMVQKQALHYLIGFTALLVAAQIPPRLYQLLAPWAYLLGVLALIGVLVLGVSGKGAQRWLAIPGLPRFQPSELMKLALPLLIAWYLATKGSPPKLFTLAKAMILIAIPLVLILKQPDLGTSILIGASGILVLFFAGMPWWLIFSMISIVAACAPLMWFFVMHAYQKQRVLTFINPESDPLGSGWNIIQSKTAIGSGGIEGKGWLQGTQSQLEFLPESHTDFIIAVLAEELGLIGVLFLLTVYFLIIMRGLYLASVCPSLFGRLLSGSLIVTFFIYVFVNIGMVSGLLPVVGVPLPLVSWGGTSVVSLLAGFGIMMSMHTHKLK
ncbi:MAG: rod shape-determining protein RodA [Oleispira sp.]